MNWIVLIYKVPNKPTSKRVYIWRKLKKIGAISIQDAVFILPYSEQTLERFQWLATEIIDMGGQVTLFKSDSINLRQDEVLKEDFNTNIQMEYKKLIEEINDLKVEDDQNDRTKKINQIVKKYMSIKHFDYFNNELGDHVKDMIELELRGRKDD